VAQAIQREERRIQETVTISEKSKLVRTSGKISCKVGIVSRKHSSHDFETIVACDEEQFFYFFDTTNHDKQ